jgi:dipeptidyl-peptidase III
MLSDSPSTLGFPSTDSQSAYYPGPLQLSKDEIAAVSHQLERHHIYPENTRIQKDLQNGNPIYNVLQASTESDNSLRQLPIEGSDLSIHLVRGDHSAELLRICKNLSKAMEYTANKRQTEVISQYIQSFQTGDLEQYRKSQRTWVADKAPNVECIFGFVEPYRDPLGIRSEFEALVSISNVKETRVLSELVQNSDTFVRRLPWTSGCTDNNGKGPFEQALFEAPDFASIHSTSSHAPCNIHIPNKCPSTRILFQYHLCRNQPSKREHLWLFFEIWLMEQSTMTYARSVASKTS